MAARSDQPPQPRQRRRQQVKQPDDPVARVFAGARRAAHAEAPDVDIDRTGDDAGHDLARDDHARIWARLAGGIHRVFPDERGGVGLGVDVKKEQRLGRLHGEALKMRIDAVADDVVHPHEPRVLGVHERELAAALVERGVAERHVVGHRAKLAGAREREEAFLAVDDVAAEQEAAVTFAVGVLEHLALAAAAGALVRDHEAVVVRGDDLHGRAVHGDPALGLADVEQHAVDALLRARAGVEVVAEKLVEALAAVMHDDLLAAEVGVAERRRHVDHRLGREAGGDLRGGEHALEQSEPEGEEAGVVGRDHDGVGALPRHAGHEGEHRQRLRAQPREGGLTQLGEIAAEALPVRGLVGGQRVADDHAVGIAAAHVGLGVVGGDAVAGAADDRLDHAALAGGLIGDLVPAFTGVAHGERHEIVEGIRHGEARAGAQELGGLGGQGKRQGAGGPGGDGRNGGCIHGWKSGVAFGEGLIAEAGMAQPRSLRPTVARRARTGLDGGVAGGGRAAHGMGVL
ncbi:MAG: hypothetical protein BWX86_01816 [Verrucomicrobia bacterium ADurb.Bin122]|nr:MAG: hypothetical protein BWX86_01816 [Verrucomicrobia bacterium ADurb.Bin122]